jgi:hypothetical protein
MKFFNTAGPVNQADHYKLDPLHRWDLEEILMLIQQKKYFLLHAPRQTGKTSSLLALQKYLNAGDEFSAIYANFECGQASRNNKEEALTSIIRQLKLRSDELLDPEKLNQIEKEALSGESGMALNEFIQGLCKLSPKPLILLIDEIDSLIGDTLISVLRQLRSGYDIRPERFPQSIVLCGVVDIKDYKIHRSDGEIITGGSCFNINRFSPEWVNADGSIHSEKLVTMFQQFWRENSEFWHNQIQGYLEAAPHLVFQGFLQRVANGQGLIEREYGLGRGRADLYLRWKSPNADQRIVFELKVRTEREKTTAAYEKLVAEGLEQTAGYADKCDAEESHLIIFDRRDDIPWEDKISGNLREFNGRKITVWGM